MFIISKRLRLWLLISVFGLFAAVPAAGQGRGQGPSKKDKESKAPITVEFAVGAAREVLVAQGFEVFRVEVHDDYQVVHYRAGNNGRGRGHGPPAKLVIRQSETRVVLEEATPDLRLEIEVKLGIRLP